MHPLPEPPAPVLPIPVQPQRQPHQPPPGIPPPHYVVPIIPPHHFATPVAQHIAHPFPPVVPHLPQHAPSPPTYALYGHHQLFPAFPYPLYLLYLPFHPSPSSTSHSLPTTSHIPILNGSSDFAGWHEGVRTMICHLGGFGHIASLLDPILPHRPDLNPSAPPVLTAVSTPFELDMHSKW